MQANGVTRLVNYEYSAPNFVRRALEILPGVLSWGTLLLIFLLSWLLPFSVAVFSIVFVLYWLFRTFYLSFHLRSGYRRMREHEKTDWLARLDDLRSVDYKLQIAGWREIYHLVILPMYKEPKEVLVDSFNALMATDYPKEKFIIVLACEEKARNEVEVATAEIQEQFGENFFKFLLTWHPNNIPGEIPGKGSNEAWASKKAQELIDRLNIPYKNIIVSSFDIDTAVFSGYFSCLTYHYLTVEKPTRTSFQPIPLFTNNIWQAPAISRVFSFSSTFWHTMNQERPEKLITFSSHSMSFSALADVGFKQTNVVSDDSRIFWQCFLRYNGDYRVQPLYYPISMDANVAKNFWQTLKNLYRQQRRWAYGAADISYFLSGFLGNKKIPLLRKLSLSFELIEGHWSWATASFMIFILGWLPLVLGGEEFSQTLLGYNLPRIMSRILTVSMIGLVSSAYFALRLLPPKPPSYGRSKYVFLVTEWFLMPLMMIFFTALPALDAQTRLMLGRYMTFWPTPKHRAPSS